jgi:hypothetical protein
MAFSLANRSAEPRPLVAIERLSGIGQGDLLTG